MAKLSGLFYPFVTRSQMGALKVAALYFDEVYVLTPISVIVQKEFSGYYAELRQRIIDEYGERLGVRPATEDTPQHESVQATVDFQLQAKPLVDEQVVHIVNPFDEMKGAGLGDEFTKIIEYRARRMESLAERGHGAIVTGLVSGNSPASPVVGNAAYALCYSRGRSSRGCTAIAPGTPSRRHTTVDHEGLLQVSDHVIKSIMFDSAVLLGKRYNTIPVTGDEVSDAAFALQTVTGEYPLPSRGDYRQLRETAEVQPHWLAREVQGYEIMMQSIAENVPSFERATFEDILKLRHHCEDELTAFRQEMKKLATLLTKHSLDDQQRAEIQDIVSKEVTPIITDIERKIELSRAQWIKRIFDKSTLVETLASVASTVVLGLPPYYGLMLAAGIIGVQVGLETYYETKGITAANGLSFLLTLRKASR